MKLSISKTDKEFKTAYLVKEGDVDEAVVEHQGFPGPQQFSEQRPDVDTVVVWPSLVKKAEREKEQLGIK